MGTERHHKRRCPINSLPTFAARGRVELIEESICGYFAYGAPDPSHCSCVGGGEGSEEGIGRSNVCQGLYYTESEGTNAASNLEEVI
eukprot:scaffold4543_cov91-Skeletonema_marinoi.AAC.4